MTRVKEEQLAHMREEDFDEETEEVEEEMRLEKIQLGLRMKKVHVVAEENKNRCETLRLDNEETERNNKRLASILHAVDAVTERVKRFKEELAPNFDLEQRVNWRIARALENALPTFF